MKRIILCMMVGILCFLAMGTAGAEDSDFQIENGVLKKYKGHDTEVIIPDGVTSIGDFAFVACSNITSITIPEGVTSIGKNAFWGCQSLTNITIPDGVKSIGSCAFQTCTSLKNITLPASITSIDSAAFANCTSMTSFTFPEGVTSIGQLVLAECSALTSVTIPSSVESIETSAFMDCIHMTSVTIPDGVKRIGTNAFFNCSGLVSITIPNSVTDIADDAFVSCSSALLFITDNSYAEQYAMNCGFATSVIPATLNGYSVSLSDVVDLIFYFRVFEDCSKYDITIRYANGDEESAHFSEDLVTGENLYGVKCTMPIKKMRDITTLEVTFGSASETYSYSVSEYCEDLLEESNASLSTDEEKKVVRKLLLYGEWAIYYFGYIPLDTYSGNPEVPGSGNGSGEEPDTASLSSAEDVLSAIDSETDMAIQNGLNPFVKLDGISLVLESSIRYRAYFTFVDAEHAQSFIDMATEGNELIQVGDTNQYYIEKDSVSIAKLSENMEFQIGDITITSNPLYYIEVTLDSDSDDDLKHLCIAVYEYYSAVMEMLQKE